jgi:EpsI family protein
MLFYLNEAQGEELINGENWIVSVAGDWRLVSEQTIQIEANEKQPLNLRESVISAQAGQRLVWQTNWINGVFSTNDTRSKWLTAKQRLFGKPSHSIGIILSTPSTDDIEAAHTVLAQFLATMWPAIEQRISQFQRITQRNHPPTSARH